MPTIKKRRQLIRARRKRREKRQKLLNLTVEEQERLRKFKDVGQWELARLYGRGINNRDLEYVNFEHGKNFVEVIEELAKRFPNEKLRVLDEGSGDSSFLSDLGDKVWEKTQRKIKIDAVRTDINYDIHLKNENWNRINCGKMISPEELVKRFGLNSFHLIVSTFGGMQYTRISRIKALANIIGVLKPGGIASIATHAPDTFTKPRPLIFKELGWEANKLRKVFPSAQFSDSILQSGPASWYVLTIRKYA